MRLTDDTGVPPTPLPNRARDTVATVLHRYAGSPVPLPHRRQQIRAMAAMFGLPE